MIEMNMGAVNYYPAYAPSQQVLPGYNSMMPSLQYANTNLLYPQQNGMPYQATPISIKREAPEYNVNEQNGKKQQMNMKVTASYNYPYGKVGQPLPVPTQSVKPTQEAGNV